MSSAQEGATGRGSAANVRPAAAAGPAGPPDRFRAAARTVALLFDQRSTFDRGLTGLLAVALGALALTGIPDIVSTFPAAIDLEIPLRAAAHWSSGTPPYPPSATLVLLGPDLPYLYPPFVLPCLAPFAALPRDVVEGAWLGLLLLAAVWTCRRLTIPWIAVPFVLAWPPFAEGLITGNVQVLAFAAFVALLYVPGGGVPRQRDLAPSADLPNGLLGAWIGALKVAQLPALLYLLRRRPRAAALAIAALGFVLLVTLPLLGIDVYRDWLAQLQRTAEPAWTQGGFSLGRWLGIPESLFVVAGVALALAARGRDSAAWLGVALVVASPSVHGYTFLFLLPGLLTFRRDVAIPVAALFLGIYHVIGWWMATLIVAYLLVAVTRWPWLRAVEREVGTEVRGGSQAAEAA